MGDSLTDGRGVHCRPSPSSFTVAIPVRLRPRWLLTRAKNIACVVGRGGSARRGSLCPSPSPDDQLSAAAAVCRSIGPLQMWTLKSITN